MFSFFQSRLPASLDRGGVIALWASAGLESFTKENILGLVEPFCKDATLLIDFSKVFAEPNFSESPAFLQRRLAGDNALGFDDGVRRTVAEEDSILSLCHKLDNNLHLLRLGNPDVEKIGILSYNLAIARHSWKTVFLVLPKFSEFECLPLFRSCNLLALFYASGEDCRKQLSELEALIPADLPKERDLPLVFFSEKGDNAALQQSLKKSRLSVLLYRYAWKPRALFYALPSSWNDLGPHFAETLLLVSLKKNGVGLLERISGRTRWPLFFLLFLWVLLIPRSQMPDQSLSQSVLRTQLRQILQEPVFRYEFRKKENIRRLLRYAAGRFQALIINADELEGYQKEVVRRNNRVGSKPRIADDGTVLAKTRITFFPPAKIVNPHYDSVAPAYAYFTGMFSDSIAYLTDPWYAEKTADHRKHDGIDVGVGLGERILAPFDGRAWIVRDAVRGGNMLLLADSLRVMLFAHCDKMLYLDGQEVRRGDVIATIGMTGRTTGPHVHIGTGYRSAEGHLGSIAPFRYQLMDPISWFQEYVSSRNLP